MTLRYLDTVSIALMLVVSIVENENCLDTVGIAERCEDAGSLVLR